MKKNLLSYFAISLGILFLLSASSCKSKKGDGTAVVKEKSARFLVKKIGQDRIDAQWLDAKSKVSFKMDGSGMDATAYIRMCKDSAIWMVGKKFGIEGARVLITTDSVFILDRLNNEYQAKDLSYLRDRFNLPLAFSDLQDMILGNLILLPETSNLTTEVNKDQHYLKEKSPAEMTKEYWLNGISFAPEQMYFNDAVQGRTAAIEYRDHNKIEEIGLFSHDRHLEFRSPETGSIVLDMTFTKVTFNEPKSLKFNIPDHYKLVD